MWLMRKRRAQLSVGVATRNVAHVRFATRAALMPLL
jgi:hypothetical protein